MLMPQVASDFAKAVIERDFTRAYALTTQGLQARMSLEDFIHALENAEKKVVPPGTFGLSSNSMTFEGLANVYQEEGTPLPPEVKPESFRCWMCIEFIPDVDDPIELDACYDFWCAIVSEGGEDRIAYFEIRDPD